jgi:hypothetical protein
MVALLEDIITPTCDYADMFISTDENELQAFLNDQCFELDNPTIADPWVKELIGYTALQHYKSPLQLVAVDLEDDEGLAEAKHLGFIPMAHVRLYPKGPSGSHAVKDIVAVLSTTYNVGVTNGRDWYVHLHPTFSMPEELPSELPKIRCALTTFDYW